MFRNLFKFQSQHLFKFYFNSLHIRQTPDRKKFQLITSLTGTKSNSCYTIHFLPLKIIIG